MRRSNRGPSGRQELSDDQNKAKRDSDKEKTREALLNNILDFKKILDDKTLAENKTQLDKEHQSNVLQSISQNAAKLNLQSMDEGVLTLCHSLFNCICILHNDNNKLLFQNYYLDKRLKKIEEMLANKESKDNGGSQE